MLVDTTHKIKETEFEQLSISKGICNLLRKHDPDMSAEMSAELIIMKYFDEKREREDSEYTLNVRIDVLRKLDEIIDTLILNHPNGQVHTWTVEKIIKTVIGETDKRINARYFKYIRDYVIYDTGNKHMMYNQSFNILGFRPIIRGLMSKKLETYKEHK